MKRLAIAGIAIGGLVSVVMFLVLRKTEGAEVAYHRNPFSLKQSGYGTVLARLGQRNLDRAWHYGAVASELSSRGSAEEHAGHNHGDGGDEDHPHGVEEAGGERGAFALEFLVDLDAERFRRTSFGSWSEQQQRAISNDIESILLGGYDMDPTDYGVYNAYFHFLMYHEMRGEAEDRKRAYNISEHTLLAVSRDNEDPMPWLTASTATLNQFFIHLADFRKEEGDSKATLPTDVLIKYQDRMKYCLGHYYKLQDEAVQAGRWEKVPGDRRKEADERARLGVKMLEQFQAMIDRKEKDGGGN